VGRRRQAQPRVGAGFFYELLLPAREELQPLFQLNLHLAHLLRLLLDDRELGLGDGGRLLQLIALLGDGGLGTILRP